MKYSKLLVGICLLLLFFTNMNAQGYDPLAKITAFDRAVGDQLGAAVANSDDYAVFGAPEEDHDLAGNNFLAGAGSAYVISRVTGAVQKLVASDREADAKFGSAVAIFQNYIVIGAHGNSTNLSTNNSLPFAGAAYVFKLDITGHWTQVQKLIAADRKADSYFGFSVSIDNDNLVIGAYREDTDSNGNNPMLYSGAAYVFQLNAGLWSESQKLTPLNRIGLTYFGYSVDVKDGLLIVGSQLDNKDENGNNHLTFAGGAHIFELDGGNNWNEMQKIVASDRATFDYFGHAVAISGNYAFVGAPGEDEDATGGNHVNNAGSVYVFEKNILNEWVETQKLTAIHRQESDRYGTALDMRNDIALVGAPFASLDSDGNNYLNIAGAVDVIEKNITGVWNPVQKLTNADRESGNFFGFSVSISDLFIVSGARGQRFDSAGNNLLSGAGAAYIYAKPYCIAPDVPVLTATTIECLGESVTITIDGNLNSAIYWAVYENGCGDTMVEGTGGNTITLTPTNPSTIYYIRGEDVAGCVDESIGACGMIQITIEDDEAPVAICQDITVSLDANGEAFITAADVDGGSYDNCGITLSVVAPNHFDCSDIGTNTATIQMNDANGNGAYCNAMVTVVDDAPPVAICQDITVSLDANGEAFITAVDVDGGSYDNCGITLSVVAPNYFDCSDIGVNTATIQMNDANGNGAFCNASVTVVDDSPPVAICQDITVTLDASGNAFIAVADVDGGSYDNCGNVFMAIAPTNFDVSDIGANTVTLQIHDGHGNGASCEATVTVLPTVAPYVTNKTSNEIETPILMKKEASTFSLNLFPNPASDYIQISSPENVEIQSTFLYTLSGRQFASYANDVPGDIIEIDTRNLVSGIYFLRIETNEGPKFKQFIKK